MNRLDQFKKNFALLIEIPVLIIAVSDHERGVFQYLQGLVGPLPIHPLWFTMGTLVVGIAVIMVFSNIYQDILSPEQHMVKKSLITLNLIMLLVFGVQYHLSQEDSTYYCYTFAPEGPTKCLCNYAKPDSETRQRVHPKHLSPIHPLDADVLLALANRQAGLFPHRMCPGKDTEFFSQGQALYYYYRWETGEYEFFDQAGFHPTSKKVLRPVPGELAVEVNKGYSQFQELILCGDYASDRLREKWKRKNLKELDLLGTYRGHLIRGKDTLNISLNLQAFQPTEDPHAFTFLYALTINRTHLTFPSKGQGTYHRGESFQNISLESLGFGRIKRDFDTERIIITAQEQAQAWVLEKALSL
ncbi:MAG: hypothetical protein AAFR61_08745 [Bacteroidota bacterium]